MGQSTRSHNNMGQMDQILVNHGILYGSYRSCILYSYVNHGSVTHGSYWSLVGYMRVKYGSYGSHVGQPWDILVIWSMYVSLRGHISVIWVIYGLWCGGHLWVILVFCGSYGLTMGHVYVINGSYMGHNHRNHMSYMNQPWVTYGSLGSHMGQQWVITCIIFGSYGSCMGQP